MLLQRIIKGLSIVVIISFIAGIIHSIYLIIANQYFHYGMYRILILTLQEWLNKWVIFSFLGYIGFLVVLLLAKVIWQFLPTNILQINLRDKVQPGSILFACILVFALLCCVGWAIIHYWLPHRVPIENGLAVVGILFFAVLLAWLLSYVKFTRNMALAFLLLLLMLNLYVFVDRIINSPKGPNVVLISIDTLRADHLGCYGYNRKTSPHLDSFAKRNILFKNCFVQDDWTPTSHMSILTSLYPPSHGVKRNKGLYPAITTLAEIMKDAGYLTLGFARCIYMDSKYGFSQGFDTYIVKEYNPKNPELTAEYQNSFISGYLKKYNRKKMFLFIHYYDVHSDYKRLPYDSPEPYKGMFYQDYSGDFDGGFGDRVATEYLGHLTYYRIKLKDDDVNYIISLYDSGIAYTDKCIGDLFEMLKSLGLYEDSLIILTADHGEEFQEHGCWLHHSNVFYDQTMRVPLIIKLPGKHSKHGEFENLIESIDIMPSILDFLGIERKAEMQGKSFFGLISHNKEWKKYAFAFGSNGNAFIRSNRWKILNDNLQREDGFRLFDLLEEPGENHDVKDRYPEIAASLQNQLLEKYREIAKKFGEDGLIITKRRKGSPENEVFLTQEEKQKLKSLGYVK